MYSNATTMMEAKGRTLSSKNNMKLMGPVRIMKAKETVSSMVVPLTADLLRA